MGLGLDHETEWDVCRGKGTFGQRGLRGLGLEEGAEHAEHLCAHSHLHLLAHKLKLSVSVVKERMF